MSLATTLGAGVLFGLALAAPPGPINVVIAEESVLGGWSDGFRAGLGAMTADLVLLGLALVGAVAVVERRPGLLDLLFVVGGVLMLYFAVGAVRQARTDVEVASDRERRGFTRVLLLALSNPYQVLFWMTAGVSLLTPGRIDVLAYASDALSGLVVVETGSPALVAGLFGGVAIWIVGFPAALSSTGRRVDVAGPAVAYGSGAVLAGFGCYFLAAGLLP